jgi:hypothetical protein
MHSVADDLRRESLQAAARLDPWARVELAFRLGEEDVATLARIRGISPDAAKRVFAHVRTVGRVASVSNDPDKA